MEAEDVGLMILYALTILFYFVRRNVKRCDDSQSEDTAHQPPIGASDEVDSSKPLAGLLKAHTAERTPEIRTKTVPYSPTHPSTKPSNATQLSPSSKINRILHRYGTWQRAIIMQELIKPHNGHTP